jgi:hypothetical protein
MSEPSADLQFDQAQYDAPKAGVTCGMCGKPVGAQYWQWMGRVACASCREQVGQLEARAMSPQVFAKAAFLGSLTALGCGIGYALFVWGTKSQFALITIGIAYLVASVIRKATGNVSGLRYQVLAVVLTYFASTMGYAPGLLRGITEKHESRTAGASADPSSELSRDDREKTKPIPAAALAKAGIYMFGVLLAAPLLEATEAPIGLLIIGIGLWEAWRRARPLPTVVAGPYRVAVVPEPPPP